MQITCLLQTKCFCFVLFCFVFCACMSKLQSWTKLLRKLRTWGAFFSKLRSRLILTSPFPSGSSVVRSSKESRIPRHLQEATLNWGRGFSLCKAVDLEIVLLRQEVRINENIFSSSFVQDCRINKLLFPSFSCSLIPRRQCLTISIPTDHQLELFTWGSNTNFTLGHKDESTRYTPEILECLTEDVKLCIKEVQFYCQYKPKISGHSCLDLFLFMFMLKLVAIFLFAYWMFACFNCVRL